MPQVDAYQVVWPRCAVTNPDDDEQTILSEGELVPDWVKPEILSALLTVGAIRQITVLVKEAEAPKAKAGATK